MQPALSTKQLTVVQQNRAVISSKLRFSGARLLYCHRNACAAIMIPLSANEKSLAE